MNTKDTVRALLDRLPDDCTLDDVLYHVYVIQAVEQGLAAIEEGRTLTHEEVVEKLREKWVPVPEWHLKIVEERLAEHRSDPAPSRSAFEMLDELSLIMTDRSLAPDAPEREA
jgi:hypothetical protein